MAKTRKRTFQNGAPRISNNRERRLWLDGWHAGYEHGRKLGYKWGKAQWRKLCQASTGVTPQ